MSGLFNNRILSEAETLKIVSKHTGIPTDSVKLVIQEYKNVIVEQVSLNGPGSFIIPGLLKIKRIYIPAEPAKSFISNTTGRLVELKGKKAKHSIEIKILQRLEELLPLKKEEV